VKPEELRETFEVDEIAVGVLVTQLGEKPIEGGGKTLECGRIGPPPVNPFDDLADGLLGHWGTLRPPVGVLPGWVAEDTQDHVEIAVDLVFRVVLTDDLPKLSEEEMVSYEFGASFRRHHRSSRRAVSPRPDLLANTS